MKNDKCAECMYSRSMNQKRPRECVMCGNIEGKRRGKIELIPLVKNPQELENLLERIKNTDYPNDRLISSLDITFQEGAIKEKGINGVQFTALIQIALEVLKKLNDTFSCRENAITITKLEEALMWQESRTKDRELRKVEGYSKK